MNKRTLERVLLTIIAGATALVSCIDKDYDLSNLDKTMGISTGTTLRLPISSTGGLILKNIFDLADDSPIDTIDLNGEKVYYLDKGDTTKTEINIGSITIDAPSLATISPEVPRSEWPTAVKSQHRAPAAGYSFVYNLEDRANISYDGTSSTTIDSRVVDIRHIGFEDGLAINYAIYVTGNGRLQRVHFDSLALEIPTGFDISGVTYTEYSQSGLQIRRKDGEISTTAQGTTLITFFSPENEGDVEGFNLAGQGVFSIHLGGASVGTGSLINFNEDTHRAALAAGDIKLHGFMRAGESDIDLSDLTPGESAAIIAGNYEELLPMALTFHGDGTFNNAITIKTFSGHIRHIVDNIENIKLNNLPNFLEGNDVTLDLVNPQLYLYIYTDLATTCNTDVTITPYRDNLPSAEGITANISYDGSKLWPKVIMLVQDPTDVPFPLDYYLEYEKEVQGGKDVGSLIRRIPHYIKVTGKDNSPNIVVDLPNCEDIVINRPYKVDLSYRIYSPLNFGPNFQIVYSDKEENMDLGSDLNEFEFDFLQIEGLAISDIPLGVTLTIVPLTKTGTAIPDLRVLYKSGTGAYVADGFRIRANADGSPQDAVGIRVVAAPGHELNEFLREGPEQLDGIEFKAVLNQPTDDSVLRTKARIKLKDLVFSVMGNYIFND